LEIIDGRVRLRTKQLLKAWTSELKPFFKDYISLYKMEKRLTTMSVKDLIDHASKSGIKKMVVCGGNKADNDHITKIAQEFNEIIPVGGVSVSTGLKAALNEIKRCSELGVSAINMSPFMVKLNANDKKLYPIYGLCELLNKPIIIHGSLHYWREAYIMHGHPMFIDEVAVDFPELKIIISHGGNGFDSSVLPVAQRHPNVFLEFSALRPKYIDHRFIHAANTYLKNKCIFGTDYPLIEF